MDELDSIAFIASRMIATGKTPLTVGILGKADTGKTYIVSKMQDSPIMSTQKLINVNFNAWTFFGSDRLWSGLLYDMINSIEHEFGWLDFNAFKYIKSIILSICLMILCITLFCIQDITFITILSTCAFIASITNVVYKVSGTLSRRLNMTRLGLGYMHKIKMELFNTVYPYVRRKNARIVIYLDDLDKCDTDTLLNVFRAISMLLVKDAPIVILLSFDIHNIQAKIDCCVHKDYLSNMIQIPLYLPTLSHTITYPNIDKSRARELLNVNSDNAALEEINRNYPCKGSHDTKINTFVRNFNVFTSSLTMENPNIYDKYFAHKPSYLCYINNLYKYQLLLHPDGNILQKFNVLGGLEPHIMWLIFEKVNDIIYFNKLNDVNDNMDVSLYNIYNELADVNPSKHFKSFLQESELTVNDCYIMGKYIFNVHM
uniref:KAP family P-loop domain protein n=1 Tax=Megaviridae environmental sample TaxID=1737588 RepID=A0A5J6VHA0_9VIRU|nr:MAG: KAP family P-loop domain protein [Megaviridae environmental sample]